MEHKEEIIYSLSNGVIADDLERILKVISVTGNHFRNNILKNAYEVNYNDRKSCVSHCFYCCISTKGPFISRLFAVINKC